MKRTSLNPAPKKRSTGKSLRQAKQADHSRVTGHESKVDLNPTPIESSPSDLRRFKKLPKEIGVMLIAAGVVGVILPGPGTPALVAGGLALWPGAFGKLESWLERRYPGVHQRSMKQIDRFLDDLEKRYPY